MSSLIKLLATLPEKTRNKVINEYPALKPPNNETVPNFENPPNRNEAVWAVMGLGVFLVLVTGSLRVSTLFSHGKLRIENLIGCAAYLPYIGCIVMQALLTTNIGFMVNQWDVYVVTLLDLLFYLYIYRIFYCAVMMMGKTAILLEWLRIFLPDRRKTWFFWAAHIMLTLNVLYYMIAIILTTVSCIPTRKIWQPWVDGHCFNRRTNDVITAWLNLFTDLAILLLPQPIIWRLNMSRQRKIGIAIIFSIGLIVVACAIGRIHSNMILEYDGNTISGATLNAIWAFGETTSLLIVFATPSIPKAFSQNTLLGSMLHTLQSWRRIKDSQATGSSGSKQAIHPPTIGGTGGKPKKSRRHGLTDISLMQTQTDEEHEMGLKQNMSQSEGGLASIEVVKMTRVESNHKEPTSRSSSDPILDRQHPWVNSRGG